MATVALSSVNLCPIHFGQFEKINNLTQNIEASLLYSKLTFHQEHSKIIKSGKQWIARSREQLANWFNHNPKKIDSLLNLLSEKGLIEKKVGLWYGKKRLFISTKKEDAEHAINVSLLNSLIETTGSLRTAIIFSRIAFAQANTKIMQEEKPWCCIKKQAFANWTGLSIRTIDSILNELIGKGLILKKNFIFSGKRQSHFHIPQFVIEQLHTNWQAAKLENKQQVIHTENCRLQPAEKGVSIRIRSKIKKTINKTAGAISFNKIGMELSKKQTLYLKGALQRTIHQKNLKLSNVNEVCQQLVFAILNPTQHKHITSFKHVVSRYMKILADGNWKTPFGFYKYNQIGRQIKDKQQQAKQVWGQLKKEEIAQSRDVFQSIRGLLSHESSSGSQHATASAMRVIDQIATLTQEAKKNREISHIKKAEQLTQLLQTYIKAGADRKQVRCYAKERIQ